MEDTEIKVAVFGVLNEHYRNDFHLFGHRTQFFVLAQAGILGFYFSRLLTPEAPTWARLKIAGAGLFLCVVWWLVARSSIYWIGVWRREVVALDTDINPAQSFTRGEALGSEQRRLYERLRPEVVASTMPIVFAIAWVFVAWMRLSAG